MFRVINCETPIVAGIETASCISIVLVEPFFLSGRRKRNVDMVVWDLTDGRVVVI